MPAVITTVGTGIALVKAAKPPAFVVPTILNTTVDVAFIVGTATFTAEPVPVVVPILVESNGERFKQKIPFGKIS